MKRIAPVVVILGLAALAAWWLLGRKAPTHPATSGSASTTTVTASHAKKPDPRTLAKGSIAGTVKDDKGAPLAAATVCFNRYSAELPAGLDDDEGCVVTDASGAFAFKDLFSAHYTVIAGKARYRSASFDTGKTGFIDLGAGENRAGVDIVLVAGGVVELTGVVNDISGGPIAHAKVSAIAGRWTLGADTPSFETDETGAFSLWVAPGTQTVTARADGYASARETARAPGRVEILLTPESSLSGTVVDAKTNAPITDVDVIVTRSDVEDMNIAGDNFSGHTDDKGVFKVTGLVPGRYIGRTRSTKGYGASEGSTLVGLGQAADGMIVRVAPAVSVRGTVRMAESKKPCPNSSVSLKSDTAGDVSGAAEDDGTFELVGVRPGTYVATAWCGEGIARDEYPPVVVATKDIEGVLIELDASGTLTGKVTTSSGAIAPDATLMAGSTPTPGSKEKRHWSTATTGSDGTYTMTSLAAATYHIDIESPLGRTPVEGDSATVKAGDVVIANFVLRDVGTITGTVVDQTGAPVAGALIRAVTTATTSEYQGNNTDTTDATGTFTIPSLRPGEYMVSAWRANSTESLHDPSTKKIATTTVTVTAGAATTAKLTVETQKGRIKGIVVDAQGKPVPDAFVAAARQSVSDNGVSLSAVESTRDSYWGADNKPVLTSTDGTFTIDHLADGTYTLRAFRRGGGEAVQDLVKPGATNVKLQIAQPGSIAGHVKVSEGAIPEFLSVEVKDLDSGFDRSETFFQTAGAFTVRDLPEGKFRVVVTGDSGTGDVTVPLAAGEQKTGVEVSLDTLLTLTGRVIDAETKQPVSGMQVTSQRTGGNTQTFTFSEDPDAMTDAAGAFKLKRVAKAKVSIQGIPRDYGHSPYEFFQIVRDMSKATTTTIALGDIKIIKKRLQEGQMEGSLGMEWEPDDAEHEKITSIEPGGPASKADIKVGDVITAINDFATDDDSVRAEDFLEGPAGATVTLKLARGPSVTLTFAPPKS